MECALLEGIVTAGSTPAALTRRIFKWGFPHSSLKNKKGEKRKMELPYIERIGENVRGIDPKQYKKFFYVVNRGKIFVFAGGGRSFFSIRVAMSQIYLSGIQVMTLYGENFPGKNIEDALPRLQKLARLLKGDVVFLVNSASGETETPKDGLKDLKIALESKNMKNIRVAAITGNPDSTVGVISRELGATLELKSGTSDENEPDKVMERGVMGDISELGSLLILQKTKEAILRGKTASWVITGMDREMGILERMIPKITERKNYQYLAKKIAEKNDLLFGALGRSNNVSEITAVRMLHIRKAMKCDTFTSGPFSSKLGPGSTALYVSYSGETHPVVKWAQNSASRRVSNYCVTGNRHSSLASLAQPIVIRSSESNFYERATFGLSPLPLLVVKELDGLGFRLRQDIMKEYHSFTE